MYYATIQHHRPQRYVWRSVYYIVCIALSLIFLFPLAWTALTSVKPSVEAAASPPTFLPSHISFENYAAIAGIGSGIWSYVSNSVTVTLLTVAMTLVLSTLGGYGFSRFSFPAKNLIFLVILATLMIPFQSILTPLFLVLTFIHLQNTLLGLALVYVTFQLPFAIFMMRNSFDNIPRELQDAALIDGCSSMSMLGRVMLPIAFPGVITVALFAFFNAWNEFLAALILLSDSDKYTLPIYLTNLQHGMFGTVNWGALQSGVVITMLPCIVIFLLLQRYYINGLIAGAVKA
jgi:multiple sugar transport system permease protein